MSADAISFSMRARSLGLERSALTLFLLRLNSGKKPAPEPISVRVLSPPGGSTLITSAPRSPRIMPQVGPITMWVNSTTRIPVSGRRGAPPRGVLRRRTADFATFFSFAERAPAGRRVEGRLGAVRDFFFLAGIRLLALVRLIFLLLLFRRLGGSTGGIEADIDHVG